MVSLSRRLNAIQKHAVKRALGLLNEEGKCLVVMTTGTGKTRVGAKVIQKLKRARVLWLTQTEELIQQSRKDLADFLGEDVGLYQRGERDLESRIVVASLQTIWKDECLRNIDRKHFDLVVVDEAHHAPAMSWLKVLTHFKCKRLGLTATPERNDGEDLFKIFGNAAFQLNYEDAKRLKLISSEVYRVILTNSRLNGIVKNSGEYKPSELDRLVVSQNRNEIIVDSYLKYGRTFMRKEGLPFKAICFCITTTHAKRMRDLFRSYGISSELLISKHNIATKRGSESPMTEKERRETWETFRTTDKIEILCVVDVLNEGKNLPDCGVLLMARPTRSAIIFQQQMGRGCRRIDGKKDKFMVLDFVDLINQRYAPMTLSKITGRRYSPEEIIVDYYRGKDPIVVDEYIHYLSREYQYYAEPVWNKEKCLRALIDFFQKHGSISSKDLVTHKTGLPNRTTIKRYWPSVSECFKELGLGEIVKKQWTLPEAETAILQYFREHGKILVTDLGSKNRLPSKKTIQKFWGSWNRAARLFGLKTYWDKTRIAKSAYIFFRRHGRFPKASEFGSITETPAFSNVKRHFGSLNKLKAYALERHFKGF